MTHWNIDIEIVTIRKGAWPKYEYVRSALAPQRRSAAAGTGDTRTSRASQNERVAVAGADRERRQG